MLKLKGGQRARKGTYIKMTTGEFITVERDGEILQGGGEVTYMKVPALMAMILGPFMGLALVIFLPFIGIVMVAGFLAGKIGQAIGSAARGMAVAVAPNWVAGVSYLAKSEGRRGTTTRPRDKETEDLLTELEREIIAKRHHEEPMER